MRIFSCPSSLSCASWAETATSLEVTGAAREYYQFGHISGQGLVTDRGRPVARLAPLDGEAAVEGRMAGLVRAGLIEPPKRPLDLSILDAARPADPEGRSLEAVLEERAEGW